MPVDIRGIQKSNYCLARGPDRNGVDAVYGDQRSPRMGQHYWFREALSERDWGSNAAL